MQEIQEYNGLTQNIHTNNNRLIKVQPLQRIGNAANIAYKKSLLEKFIWRMLSHLWRQRHHVATPWQQVSTVTRQRWTVRFRDIFCVTSRLGELVPISCAIIKLSSKPRLLYCATCEPGVDWKCRTGNFRTVKCRTGKRRTKKNAGGNWRTTVAHIINQNTRVPDAQMLQII